MTRFWQFVRARRASMLLEFALVGPVFTFCLIFIMEVGYDLYAQEMLDFGMQTAARQIQLGVAQGVKPGAGVAPTGANYAAAFKATYLCPLVSGLLNCNAIWVNVAPLPAGGDYSTLGGAAIPQVGGTYAPVYCPGLPKQLMLVTAVYTSPSMVSAFVPSLATIYGGTFVHATLSTVAFVNESFTADSTIVTNPGCA